MNSSQVAVFGGVTAALLCLVVTSVPASPRVLSQEHCENIITTVVSGVEQVGPAMTLRLYTNMIEGGYKEGNYTANEARKVYFLTARSVVSALEGSITTENSGERANFLCKELRKDYLND